MSGGGKTSCCSCVFVFGTTQGGGGVPSLHAAVQSGPGLHGPAASGLAQHVQHRGRSDEPRMGRERRGRGRLRREPPSSRRQITPHGCHGIRLCNLQHRGFGRCTFTLWVRSHSNCGYTVQLDRPIAEFSFFAVRPSQLASVLLSLGL